MRRAAGGATLDGSRRARDDQSMSDESKREGDDRFNLTVLAVLGWILPLAGFVWGPGDWWMHVIWLAIGTAVLALYDRTHLSAEDGSAKDI
jgi:hypothetical protein